MSVSAPMSVEWAAELDANVTKARIELINVKEQVAEVRMELARVAQEHKMLREAYIATGQALLTFRGRLRWLLKGR